MIQPKVLELIVKQQKIPQKSNIIDRELLVSIPKSSTQAIIITGIRRSGKSTLLSQIIKRSNKKANYLNFEDPRLVSFKIEDFLLLEKIFNKINNQNSIFFFDEIQNISEWERHIRYLLDHEKKCFLTGSNASLLSRELGTKLTGRHRSFELFPFSFREYSLLRKQKISLKLFEKFFHEGGFPEYLKLKESTYLPQLVDDILYRDIIVRYNIKESSLIRQIAIYLISNCTRLFSYNRLAKTFKIAVNTIRSYISYFEDSYLLFSIPIYDFSLKKQAVNPKKIYIIDQGIINTTTHNFSPDLGRILENIVFIELRRRYKEIFYHKEEKGECDFIVTDRNHPIMAIQVCYSLNQENLQRELNGIKLAMKKCKLKNGLILTYNQEDQFDNISVIPVWKWILSNA